MSQIAVTEPGTVTFNGAPLELAKSSRKTWSADGITIRLCIDTRWAATRDGSGRYAPAAATAQAALDNLAAMERKEARRAALTPGQRFAYDMRAYLHIGPRTRRYRNGTDLHREIVRTGIEVVTERFGYSDRFVEAVRPAYGALLSYNKHIPTSRAGTRVSLYVNQLSSWQLLDLLAEMTDADVIHVGGGERWFQELNRSLTYGTANPISGHQPVHRTA
ncbi:hypothetical protein [Streptomyces sp. 7N604]|uniref:hypothetical protein n=1 Tax=Streptomyces sp. 7N604 TaxID=3457415 RepID=UPI003FD14EB4